MNLSNKELYGEVFTPLHIVKDMMAQIPSWEGSVLEPTCGNGNFIIEILKEKLKIQSVEDSLKSITGYDILDKNVEETRIKIEDLLNTNKYNSLINVFKADFLNTDIKYHDIIIGNPPYQKMNGGFNKSAQPYYPEFVEKCLKLNPKYFSMIIPSRWFYRTKGVTGFYDLMVEQNIKSIKHYDTYDKVFENTSIAGGVSYFLIEKGYKGACCFNGVMRNLKQHDIIISNNDYLSVLNYVLSNYQVFFNKFVLPGKPFGVRGNHKEEPSNYSIECYFQQKEIKLVSTYTDKFNVKSKYKVCSGKTSSERNLEVDKEGRRRVFNNVFIIEPGKICSETYLVLAAFDTLKEAENCISYLKTKFARFLLGVSMGTQDLSKDKFRYVPYVDFNKEYSDLDFENNIVDKYIKPYYKK
jgi:hypothetical protein